MSYRAETQQNFIFSFCFIFGANVPFIGWKYVKGKREPSCTHFTFTFAHSVSEFQIKLFRFVTVCVCVAFALRTTKNGLQKNHTNYVHTNGTRLEHEREKNGPVLYDWRRVWYWTKRSANQKLQINRSVESGCRYGVIRCHCNTVNCRRCRHCYSRRCRYRRQ